MIGSYGGDVSNSVVPIEAGLPAVVRRAPAPELRRYVAGYSGWTAHDPESIHLRVTPTGAAVLVVNFEAPLLLTPATAKPATAAMAKPAMGQDPAGEALPVERPYQVSFAGLRRSYLHTRYDGPSRGLQVDLRPMGAFLLVGTSMSELTDVIVDGPRLADLGLAELVDRLYEAPTWADRFDAVDQTLRARIAGAEGESPIVRRAWTELVRTHGRVGVEQLVDNAGCSHRHLVALFRNQVGIGPKLLGRILRFQRASRLLTVGYPHGLGSLAAYCGFSDQAHMIREFRAFSGTTPAAFVRTVGPFPADDELDLSS